MVDVDQPEALEELDDVTSTLPVIPEKRCAACEECDDRRGDVGPGAPSWEHIPELGTRRELMEFPSLRQTVEAHIAEPDGILATYAFKEQVKCSLKGNHPHRQGLVVKTLCEIVLCMERVCGRKSIIGFDGIIRDHDARRRYHADLRLLNNWLPEAKRRLCDVTKRAGFRADALDTMRTELPSLYGELSRRRNSAHGDEVRATSEQLNKLPEGFGEDSTPRLVGLRILDPMTAAVSRLAATLDSYAKLEREHPPIDGPSADALRRIATKFDERTRRLDEWYRETAHFLTAYNLNLALLALGRENARVTREGDGWRISYMWAESALLPIGEPA